MGAIGKLRKLPAEQPQERFIQQSGWLQRVQPAIPPQRRPGQPVQLAVDQRKRFSSASRSPSRTRPNSNVMSSGPCPSVGSGKPPVYSGHSVVSGTPSSFASERRISIIATGSFAFLFF